MVQSNDGRGCTRARLLHATPIANIPAQILRTVGYSVFPRQAADFSGSIVQFQSHVRSQSDGVCNVINCSCARTNIENAHVFLGGSIIC